MLCNIGNIAQANLGESRAQLLQRYVRPFREYQDGPTLKIFFLYKQYIVQARLRDGHSVTECIWHTNRTDHFTLEAARKIGTTITGQTNWVTKGNTLTTPAGAYIDLSNQPGHRSMIIVTTLDELARNNEPPKEDF